MTVSKEQVLGSFLNDALRMCGEATSMIKKMTVDPGARLTAQELYQLYRIIHTIKSTSTMIEGGGEVVQAFHDFESRLAEILAQKTFSKRDWLPLAVESLKKGFIALRALQQKHQVPEEEAEQTEEEDLGVVVKLSWQGEEVVLWFQCSSLVSVFPPTEFNENDAVCLDGAWVPVIRDAGTTGPLFGLGVRTSSGLSLVAVQEIVDLANWEKAQAIGAYSGVEALEAAQAAA